MSNLALASANTLYYTGLLHDAQGQLSEVAERRSELSLIMSESESTNVAAEREDRALEQIQNQLETQIHLVESLKKAAEDLLKTAAKGSAPNFSASG